MISEKEIRRVSFVLNNTKRLSNKFSEETNEAIEDLKSDLIDIRSMEKEKESIFLKKFNDLENKIKKVISMNYP